MTFSISKRVGWAIAISSVIVLLVSGAYVFAYLFIWEEAEAGGPKEWSEFATYFAGTAGTALGFATVILVYDTLRQTRNQVRELKNQARSAELRDRFATLQWRMDRLIETWDYFMQNFTHPFLVISLEGERPYLNRERLVTWGEFLYRSGLAELIRTQNQEGPQCHVEIMDVFNRDFPTVQNLLAELAHYSREYDQEASETGRSGRIVTDFYRRRVRDPLEAMHAASAIDNTVYEQLKTDRLDGEAWWHEKEVQGKYKAGRRARYGEA